MVVVTQNALVGVDAPTALAPVPAEPGRGCARASAAWVHATVPPGLYGAWRVAALRDAGAWETRDAAMAYTCARSARPVQV